MIYVTFKFFTRNYSFIINNDLYRKIIINNGIKRNKYFISKVVTLILVISVIYFVIIFSLLFTIIIFKLYLDLYMLLINYQKYLFYINFLIPMFNDNKLVLNNLYYAIIFLIIMILNYIIWDNKDL